MFTFEAIPIGTEIGARSSVVTIDIIERWRRLFPADSCGRDVPPGLAMVMAMRAYDEILTPRPPGNIHGSQHVEIVRAPRAGERLTTTLTCRGKELKRGTSWVHLATRTVGEDGSVCLLGRMSIVWAA